MSDNIAQKLRNNNIVSNIRGYRYLDISEPVGGGGGGGGDFSTPRHRVSARRGADRVLVAGISAVIVRRFAGSYILTVVNDRRRARFAKAARPKV